MRVDADLHDPDVRDRELLRESPSKLVLEDHPFAEEHDSEQLIGRASLSERPGELVVGDESLPDQQLAEPWGLGVLRQRQEQRSR